VVGLTGLEPRRELTSAVERHVPGSINLARRQGWEQRARRARWSTAGLVALLLIPLIAFAAKPSQAQDGSAGLAGTATESPTPTYSPDITDSYTPVPLETTPAPTTSSMPNDTFGYADVCTGAVFSGAAAYGSSVPHFIYVNEGDAYLSIPDQWTTNDPAQIQLVACVTTSTGSTIRTCRYQGTSGNIVTQKLVHTTYDIWIHQAKTGAVVAHSNFSGGKTNCADIITTFNGQADPLQFTDPTDAQLQDSIGKYVT
jgi:hypothetical protein